MITCRFEAGNETSDLRHVVTDIVCLRGDGSDAEVLMVKRAEHLIEGGKWALPGGFMDRDERVAQCAEREFLEETGNTCTNMRLIDIDTRPEREDRQNVTFVFLVDMGEHVQDGDDESTAIEWLKVSDVLQTPDIAFGHERYVANAMHFKASGDQMPLLDGASLTDLH